MLSHASLFAIRTDNLKILVDVTVSGTTLKADEHVRSIGLRKRNSKRTSNFVGTTLFAQKNG